MRRILPFYLLCLCGCWKKPPEADPWAYVPCRPTDVWETSNIDLCINGKVRSEKTAITPSESETLDLAALFDIGLQNSPDTAQTWAIAREAATVWGMVRSKFYPELTFDANLSQYHQGFAFSGSSVLEQTQLQGSPLGELRYTFWDFGERNFRSDEKMYALHYSNWTHNQQIQKVLQSIADYYYNYLYQKALLSAAEMDLQDAWRTFDAADQKVKTGVADIADFLQAKTSYLQRKVDLSTQQGMTEKARIDLLHQIGLTTDTPIKVGQFPDQVPIQKLTTDAKHLLVMAENTRSEIRAAKANVQAKEASIQVAKATPLPKVQGTVDAGYTWYGGVSQTIGQYLVKLDITFPIFAGFYYRNQIKKAQADLKSACANLKSKELEVANQVMNAYTDFKVATQELPLTGDYLACAEEELASTLSRYKQGITTILDVLNAQASVSNARAKYADGKNRLFTSMIDLSFSTGTLFYSENSSPSYVETKDVQMCPIRLFEEGTIFTPQNPRQDVPFPEVLKQQEQESIP